MVIVSNVTGESNLHHIDAAFVTDFNKENKHVKLCHMINLDAYMYVIRLRENTKLFG